MLAPIVIIGLSLAAAVGAAMRPNLRQTRNDYLAWRLRRAEVTPIANIRRGTVVKIVGRVEAAAPLVEAPLTARPGVAMVTSVDIDIGRSDSPALTPFVREEHAYDFVVRDGSGVARVRGARVRVLAEPKPIGASTRADDWLKRHRLHKRFLGMPRKLRFSEAVLEPGFEVAVLGLCVDGGAQNDGPYRATCAATITIDAPSRGRVVIAW